nr:MAG TPA: hypothetical protein [Bacteriophage sp.]
MFWVTIDYYYICSTLNEGREEIKFKKNLDSFTIYYFDNSIKSSKFV